MGRAPCRGPSSRPPSNPDHDLRLLRIVIITKSGQSIDMYVGRSAAHVQVHRVWPAPKSQTCATRWQHRRQKLIHRVSPKMSHGPMADQPGTRLDVLDVAFKMLTRRPMSCLMSPSPLVHADQYSLRSIYWLGGRLFCICDFPELFWSSVLLSDSFTNKLLARRRNWQEPRIGDRYRSPSWCATSLMFCTRLFLSVIISF